MMDLVSERFDSLHGTPAEDDFGASGLAGLSATPKFLECRYIYDTAGSKLFEEIWIESSWNILMCETRCALQRHSVCHARCVEKCMTKRAR